MNGPLPKWLLSILCCFVRLVSIGIAGLAAGPLRARDGGLQGCVVRREMELPFCSCHGLLSLHI